MPSYKQSTLHTLRDRRLDGERQAERALAEALAAERRAEVEAARLAAVVNDARAATAAARDAEGGAGASAPERAIDAQARRLYWKRLDDRVRAAIDTFERHRAGALAEAIRARDAARAAHVTARQRREVVDKAIAKREAAARRDAERRADVEQDDRSRGGR